MKNNHKEDGWRRRQGKKKDRVDAVDWRVVGGVGVGWQKVRGRVERNGENKRGERRRENKQKKKEKLGKEVQDIGSLGRRHI